MVVEAHVRDLLSLADLDLSKEERMEFRGLSKWLRSDDCYLHKLGANVVELQPVQNLMPEVSRNTIGDIYRNLIFFPRHLFIPVIPQMARVWREFSQLVDDFHQSGIAVVIDVVYNHMGIPPNLMHLDRELYFMINEKES